MAVAKLVLFAFIICFVAGFGKCNGSDIKSDISKQLSKLEALYESYEHLINENGADLQRLLSKARTRPAGRMAAKHSDSVETGETIEIMEPDDDANKRFLPSPTSTTSPQVFHALLSASYNVMSPRQTIVYNTVITNIGNSYDSNFGVFKAPFPGYYEFVATISAYTGYYVDVEMVLNNRMLCRAHAGAPNMDVGMCIAMVHLNIDDDVFVRHYNGRGTYIYGGYNYPSFSGHLIRRD